MQTSRASCEHAGKVSLMILTKLTLCSARATRTMHALFFVRGVEEGSTIFLVAFKRVLSTMLVTDGEKMPAALEDGEEMPAALSALAETALTLIGSSANLLR